MGKVDQHDTHCSHSRAISILILNITQLQPLTLIQETHLTPILRLHQNQLQQDPRSTPTSTYSLTIRSILDLVQK